MVPLNSRSYVVAAWIGIGLQAAGLVVLLILGRWWGAAIMSAFLIASVAFVAFEDRLPEVFDLLFVAAAVLNAAGWVWDLFRRIWGYDEIVHGYTVFTITLSLGFLVFYSVRLQFRGHGALYVLAIASFGIALGALWELVEWAFGVIGSQTDTMIDLIMDALGAALAGLAAAWAVSREPRDQLHDHRPRSASGA